MKKPFAIQPNSTKNTNRPSTLHDTHPDMKSLNSSNPFEKSTFRRPIKAAALAVTLGAVLTLGAHAGVQQMNQVTLGAGSRLSIGNNSFIDYNRAGGLGTNAIGSGTDLTTIFQQVFNGIPGVFNIGTQTWSGLSATQGNIVSKTAWANDPNGGLFGIGAYQNLPATLGRADAYGAVTLPDQGEILFRYTYIGDTNLDGQVNGADYNNADNGFFFGIDETIPHSNWWAGDANYDGVGNGADYNDMDVSFNFGIGIVPYLTGDGGKTPGVVPEPGSLALLSMGLFGLAGVRRREKAVK